MAQRMLKKRSRDCCRLFARETKIRSMVVESGTACTSGVQFVPQNYGVWQGDPASTADRVPAWLT